MSYRKKNVLKIGVIGYGYWGPKLVRNLLSCKRTEISAIYDSSRSARRRAINDYPSIKVVSDCDDILSSSAIDVVAIVTPVSTHFDIAKKALSGGKHIFIEKPFTASVREAESLIELAERNKLQIMVDHTYLFTGAVRKIDELIRADRLGQLYYYDSTRVNLGLFQHDVNVIWDLAPHDFSIMDHIISEKPAAITVNGADHFGRGLEDIAYATIYFNSNLIAHFSFNWLSPVKIRMTLIGGSKKMLVWDDFEMDEKVKVYDKGLDIRTRKGVYSLLAKYRSGDMWAPKLDRTEALKVETEYFIDCIFNNEVPLNDGHAGLRVVRMIEAATRSLKNKGKLVNL